jgi:hypothetical protein
MLIPVPLKNLERGYNQVTTFGLALSKELGIPYNDSLLFRTTYSKNNHRKTDWTEEGIDAVLMFILMTRTMTNIIFLLTTSLQENWRPVPELENPRCSS